MVLDVGCANILACHHNLFLGTVAPVVPRRPDLLPMVERALQGDIIGNFLLTEVGHGLDIGNIETTATRVPDGYILHTPHGAAAKFMPPTGPFAPKIAAVFAKLIIDNKDLGIHPFLVKTSDEQGMCKGITSTLLPPRSGTSPLDYSITTFNRVKLPLSAFLGKSEDAYAHEHNLLNQYVSRTIVGQVSMSLVALTGAKMSACVGVDYSFRRHVQGKGPQKVPVMFFRTQQLPMLYCTAVAYVLDAWVPRALEEFTSPHLSALVRQGLAVVFKTTVCRFAITYYREVSERLGAQGTFGHNIVSQIEMDMRGLVIAEGDLTVLSIRLFSHLLQKQYVLPPPSRSDSILYQHSAGVYAQCEELLASFPRGHRDPRFNDLVLPQCEKGVLALGCAHAHACAVDAGVPKPLIELFECAAIKLDSTWYSEHISLIEMARLHKEDKAVHAALPYIREYTDGLNVRQAVTAPIVSDEAWEKWVRDVIQLKSYDGVGNQDMSGARTVSIGTSGISSAISMKGRL